MANQLVKWAKSQLLVADPAYDRHLRDYEKGLCPVSKQTDQKSARAQAPASRLDAQDTQHGLLGASIAAAAEAAPSLQTTGLS